MGSGLDAKVEKSRKQLKGKPGKEVSRCEAGKKAVSFCNSILNVGSRKPSKLMVRVCADQGWRCRQEKVRLVEFEIVFRSNMKGSSGHVKDVGQVPSRAQVDMSKMLA